MTMTGTRDRRPSKRSLLTTAGGQDVGPGPVTLTVRMLAVRNPLGHDWRLRFGSGVDPMDFAGVRIQCARCFARYWTGAHRRDATRQPKGRGYVPNDHDPRWEADCAG